MSDKVLIERELLEQISMELAPYSEHAKELRALLTAQPQASAAQSAPEYTQGVCGDGAVILRDGVRMSVEDVLAALNSAQSAPSVEREAFEAEFPRIAYAPAVYWSDELERYVGHGDAFENNGSAYQKKYDAWKANRAAWQRTQSAALFGGDERQHIICVCPDCLAEAQRKQSAGVPEGWRQFIESCSLTAGCMVNGNRLSAMASRLLTVEHSAQWPTTPRLSARPSDDDLWDQTLSERDSYHESADKLTDAIAKHFGQDFGEHSSLNAPWENALEFMRSLAAAPAQPAAQEAPTPETVWMRLLDVMRRDNGGHFYASTRDFAEAHDAIIELVAAGFFIEWRNELDDDYWMAAAGEQSEAAARFPAEPYGRLSDALNRVFERVEEPTEPAAQDQGEVQRLREALDCDRAYRNGLQAGYSFGASGDEESYQRSMAAYGKEILAASTGQEVKP